MHNALQPRTIQIAIISLLIASQSVSAGEQNGRKLNWFKRIFKTLTWDEVTQKVNTPKEICSAVRHHINYRPDTTDKWASGKEAWDRGYGDCEDIAAAISALCAKKNIEAQMFMLYPENETLGHVIVVGKWKGKFWFSSNGWFEYAKSTDDVKKRITHEMRWERGRVVAMDWDSFRGIDSVVMPAGAEKISLPIIDK